MAEVAAEGEVNIERDGSVAGSADRFERQLEMAAVVVAVELRGGRVTGVARRLMKNRAMSLTVTVVESRGSKFEADWLAAMVPPLQSAPS